jgi:hypothetical protein
MKPIAGTDLFRDYQEYYSYSLVDSNTVDFHIQQWVSTRILFEEVGDRLLAIRLGPAQLRQFRTEEVLKEYMLEELCSH